MGKKKTKVLDYCGMVFMILLIMGSLLQPLYAAESQYGIWCPGCGKWQDLYHGVIDSGTLTRTEFIDGKITYNDNGIIYINCSDCQENLIKFEWSKVPRIFNSGTENERQMWDKQYSVNTCGKNVVFPFLDISLSGNLDGSEKYYIFCDGDAFTTNSDGSTTTDRYEDAMNCYMKLFDGVAKSLTVRQENSNETNIKEVCSITSGFFTWEQWYDYGYTTSTSGSISSGLIDYLARFGRVAVRERLYEITFYANGGEGGLVVVPMQPGSNSLPKNSYVRKGYIFLGWSTSAGGSVQYMDGESIEVSSDLDLYAVWKKEPPRLSVVGDAQVRLYRDGSLVDGVVEAGDRVEIIPNKKQGREYADYSMSSGQASWDNGTEILSFIMPDIDISVEIFFRELRGLAVSLNTLFFEAYQKEPYWDGNVFNMDCTPPITVAKNMVTVEAVFYNTKTLQTEKREIHDFSIVSGNTIQSMGENAVVVEADVLQDGYVLSAQCMIQADSSSLKDLMNQTGSKTYIELKAFVDKLTARMEECERLIEELSGRLATSEAEKENYESLLLDARAEISRLTEELDKAGKEISRLEGEIAASEEELGSMEKELASMREKLAVVQQLMQDLTGTEEFDPAVLELIKEKFEELKKEKEELADLLVLLEEENKGLSDKVSQLESEKNGLENEKSDLADKVTGLENEKSDLTDKVTGLENEKSDLSDKVVGLESEKTDLGDMLSDLENENGDLTSRYEALYAAHKELLRERDALRIHNSNLLTEREDLEEQNRRLSLERDILSRSNEELSDQLRNTIGEQQYLLKEYDLLKKKYGQQSEVLEETETGKLAEVEQKLREAEKEKKELSDQIARMDQERLKLSTECQKEKTEMSAWIRKLEQELEERSKIEKETVQKTERETVSQSPSERESTEGEKETVLQETAEKETSGLIEGQEVLEESETKYEEELGTNISEENDLEHETGIMETEQGEEGIEGEQETKERTELEQQTEYRVEVEEITELTTEAITEEETFEWVFPIKDKDKGGFGGGKKVLPGILIVLAAMLLGGLILYVAMDQKEKEADYSG